MNTLDRENTALPSTLDLNHAGRTFMLAWLSGDIARGPITAEMWRAAYGKAADYQTVVNLRDGLAVEAAS